MLSPLKSALILALAAILCSCHSSDSASSRFKGGQVWEYKTRSGEEQSRLTVQHVLQNSGGDDVIFVAVNNVHITSSSSAGEWTSISSFPFTRKALNDSVMKLERTDKAEVSVNGDVLGPSPVEWQKEKGEPIQVSVAEFLNILAARKWPQAKYDSPLRPPLQR
jgi:hypothetical protein